MGKFTRKEDSDSEGMQVEPVRMVGRKIKKKVRLDPKSKTKVKPRVKQPSDDLKQAEKMSQVLLQAKELAKASPKLRRKKAARYLRKKALDKLMTGRKKKVDEDRFGLQAMEAALAERQQSQKARARADQKSRVAATQQEVKALKTAFREFRPKASGLQKLKQFLAEPGI